MELRNTIILPLKDETSTRNFFEDSAVILGIVVGNDGWANDIIQKTDRAAYARSSVRRSVWIKDEQLVFEILDKLFSNSQKFDKPQSTPYFFTLSMDKKICDLILPGHPVPDNGKIDGAYRNTEIGC
ncbi:MAG: hypothetical protein R2750_02015 [Bacteroidales bacterium]